MLQIGENKLQKTNQTEFRPEKFINKKCDKMYAQQKD